MPIRHQYVRRLGWRMPPNAVYVGRARGPRGRFGNPIHWDDYPATITARHHGITVVRRVSKAARRQMAADEFATNLRLGTLPDYPTVAEIRRDLAGKDIACWCPLDGACHGDTLLTVANEPAPLLTPAHWAVLGCAFHGGPVHSTPDLTAVIADLVDAGYLTGDGRITEVGRVCWISDAPWGAYSPALTCRPTHQ